MPPRRDPANNNNANAVPDYMQQLCQGQAQLIQLLAQNMNNNQNPPPPPPPPVDTLARFLRLNPQRFSGTPEPIVADDWLRSVKRNLETVGCTEAERVRFASHLLEGPAAAWWDNYVVTCPIDAITWTQFQEAFRAAHVSAGAMSLKKKEFRSLRQGGRSVAEYIEEFNKLARYAPDDVRNDATRQEKFLEGLNDELGVQLTVATFANCQGLIDKAIVLEGKQQAIENRKRKYNNNGGKYNSGPHQKPRTSYGGNGGHSHGHNHHGGNGHVHSGGHNHHGGNGHNHNGHNHHNGNRNGNGRNNGNGRGNGGNGSNRQNGQAPRDLSQVQCFRCKNMGHYATYCPESKPNGNGVVKPNPFNKGHVNHVNVEEIYEEPDAVIGKFLVSSVPALVLFDSGASHSFISRVFVDKHELPTVALKAPIHISSPGAEMSASMGCY